VISSPQELTEKLKSGGFGNGWNNPTTSKKNRRKLRIRRNIFDFFNESHGISDRVLRDEVEINFKPLI